LSTEEDERQVIYLDPYRWVILIIVSGAIFIHSSVTQVGKFISILEEVNEGSFQWTFVRYSAFLGLLVLYLPSCYVIERFGVRVALTSAVSVAALGAWLYYGANKESFSASSTALMTPFVLNSVTKIST